MRDTKIHKRLAVGLFCLISMLCQNSPAVDNAKIIRLTTTTSALNSGLLEKLIPAFETDAGYSVNIDAFGTGRALRSARDGNADVIIVHSPAAELKFMHAEYGLARLPLIPSSLPMPLRITATMTRLVEIASSSRPWRFFVRTATGISLLRCKVLRLPSPCPC